MGTGTGGVRGGADAGRRTGSAGAFDAGASHSGTAVAGAILVTEAYDFRIIQKNGGSMTVNTEDVPIEPKSGKGQPFAVVVMDDVVVDLARA